MKSAVYLDNGATTRVFNEVAELISKINDVDYANPSSLHSAGIRAERYLNTARAQIANTLNAAEKEIIFTSGGTESNNLAICGYLKRNVRNGKHIVTSCIEHPSVLEIFKAFSKEGYDVDFVDVDKNGVVNLETIKKILNKDTSLISIMLVNNEIGVLQQINEIVKIKKSVKKDIVIHVDAAQAFSKIEIHPKKLGIDLLSISSHKIHGPKGVGALYIRDGIKLSPIFLGGGQENLLRAGTQNVPGIAGFGLAAEMFYKDFEKFYEKVFNLKKLFLKELEKNIEDFEIISPIQSIPYILNVSFKNVKAEVLLHHLEEKNIYVSTGAACSSRKNIRSHVLKAMGIPDNIIDGAIRFSFSHFNTQDEIYYTISELKKVLPRIKIKRRL